MSVYKVREKTTDVGLRLSDMAKNQRDTSLNVNSEEATPGCCPSRQSCKEKAIPQDGPIKRKDEHGQKARHWTEKLCLEGQHPGVTSSLLTLRLVLRVRFK
jgi:hypothetical protein